MRCIMPQDGKLGQLLSPTQLVAVKQIYRNLPKNPVNLDRDLDRAKCSAKGQHDTYENLYKVSAFNRVLFFIPVPEGAVLSEDNTSYTLNGHTINRKHDRQYFIPAQPKPETLLRALAVAPASLVPASYRTASTVQKPVRRLAKATERYAPCIPAPAEHTVDGAPGILPSGLPIPDTEYQTIPSTVITNADLERALAVILPGSRAVSQRDSVNTDLQLVVRPTTSRENPLEITRPLIPASSATSIASGERIDGRLLLLGPAADAASHDAITTVANIIAETARAENPDQPVHAGLMQKLGKVGLAAIGALGLGALGAGAWWWNRHIQDEDAIPTSEASSSSRASSRV